MFRVILLYSLWILDIFMRKILVTGGAGNVGGALVEKLVQDKTNFVVVVDDLSTGFLSKLPSLEHENWKFIKADVNDYREISAIMLAYNFHYVYHFAAVVGVLRTQENPVRVLNDISGIKHILNLSKNSSVKHIFFSSSSEVYGEPVELPQHEHRTPLNSRVPYAVVKNVGESFLKSYQQEYGLAYTIFRFFNTYGPNQSTDFVVSRFLALALKGEDITIYGDGSQTRTFTYIDDNIDTIATIMNNKLLENDVINIGSEKLMTVLELANLVIKITKSKSKIVHVPALKEGDMTRRQPDNTKMKEILGRELISVEDGIKKMMASEKYLKSIGL
jgi:UDP-glucuronate decarboxylase